MYPFPGKTVVGITGGIACGKSTVCKSFEKLGWKVISTDSYAHYFLENDQIVKNEILNHFGSKVKGKRGNIDKSELARVVFSSSSDRFWLENLVHPKIREQWMNTINHSSSQKFVVEVPLLFENNLNDLFTKTISVHVSKSMQVNRLRKRGLSDVEIESRIDAQMPVSEKSNLANFVILAECHPNFLDPQINLFLKYI